MLNTTYAYAIGEVLLSLTIR